MVDIDVRGAWFEGDAAVLAGADRRFATALASAGALVFPDRGQGFALLVRVMLEQQVSVAAADAMWARLTQSVTAVTPVAIAAADDGLLRTCGFSRQKMRYARAAAEAAIEGRLDLTAIDTLPSDAAIERLCVLPGIGIWSAECFLLWSGRRDMLPAGDMALQVGWQWLSQTDARPTADQLRGALAPFRPRLSAASLLIWRFYVAQRSAGARKAAAGA